MRESSTNEDPWVLSAWLRVDDWPSTTLVARPTAMAIGMSTTTTSEERMLSGNGPRPGRCRPGRSRIRSGVGDRALSGTPVTAPLISAGPAR